ncbi:hypothetical protein DIPPA_22297 [Diplonema papillatum]|nr:hypothetical protein DIPPA_22297 [Diplonema papillatum]
MDELSSRLLKCVLESGERSRAATPLLFRLVVAASARPAAESPCAPHDAWSWEDAEDLERINVEDEEACDHAVLLELLQGKVRSAAMRKRLETPAAPFRTGTAPPAGGGDKQRGDRVFLALQVDLEASEARRAVEAAESEARDTHRWAWRAVVERTWGAACVGVQKWVRGMLARRTARRLRREALEEKTQRNAEEVRTANLSVAQRSARRFLARLRVRKEARGRANRARDGFHAEIAAACRETLSAAGFRNAGYSAAELSRLCGEARDKGVFEEAVLLPVDPTAGGESRGGVESDLLDECVVHGWSESLSVLLEAWPESPRSLVDTGVGLALLVLAARVRNPAAAALLLSAGVPGGGPLYTAPGQAYSALRARKKGCHWGRPRTPLMHCCLPPLETGFWRFVSKADPAVDEARQAVADMLLAAGGQASVVSPRALPAALLECDACGATAVHLALMSCDFEAYRHLAERRRDKLPAAPDGMGRTPLHYLCAFPCRDQDLLVDTAERAIRHFSLPLNAADSFGNTPLHYAASSQAGARLAIVLLDHGALPTLPDDRGVTALDSASFLERWTTRPAAGGRAAAKRALFKTDPRDAVQLVHALRYHVPHPSAVGTRSSKPFTSRAVPPGLAGVGAQPRRARGSPGPGVMDPPSQQGIASTVVSADPVPAPGGRLSGNELQLRSAPAPGAGYAHRHVPRAAVGRPVPKTRFRDLPVADAPYAAAACRGGGGGVTFDEYLCELCKKNGLRVPPCLAAAADAEVGVKNLSTLTVVDSYLGGKHVLVLGFLLKQATALRKLTLRGLGLSVAETCSVLAILANGYHAELAAIDIRGSAVGDRGAKLLLQVAAECANLRSVGTDATLKELDMDSLRKTLVARDGDVWGTGGRDEAASHV